MPARVRRSQLYVETDASPIEILTAVLDLGQSFSVQIFIHRRETDSDGTSPARAGECRGGEDEEAGARTGEHDNRVGI